METLVDIIKLEKFLPELQYKPGQLASVLKALPFIPVLIDRGGIYEPAVVNKDVTIDNLIDEGGYYSLFKYISTRAMKTTRYGRWLMAVFNLYGVPAPSQARIDDFAANMQNYLNNAGDLTWQDYTGLDIVEQYKISGAESCMAGERADVTELYAHLPVKLRVFKAHTGNTVVSEARVLLWDTARVGGLLRNKPIKVADRIYATSAAFRKKVFDILIEEGYTARSINHYKAKRKIFTDKDNKDIALNIHIFVDINDTLFRSKVPYIDTFQHYYYLPNQNQFVFSTRKYPRKGRLPGLHSTSGKNVLSLAVENPTIIGKSLLK